MIVVDLGRRRPKSTTLMEHRDGDRPECRFRPARLATQWLAQVPARPESGLYRAGGAGDSAGAGRGGRALVQIIRSGPGPLFTHRCGIRELNDTDSPGPSTVVRESPNTNSAVPSRTSAHSSPSCSVQALGPGGTVQAHGPGGGVGRSRV